MKRTRALLHSLWVILLVSLWAYDEASYRLTLRRIRKLARRG